MAIRRLWWLPLVVATSVVLTLVVGSAVASSGGAVVGGAVFKVAAQRGTSPSTTMSAAFVDVPEAVLSGTLPGGSSTLLLIRFSAESTCTPPPETTANPPVCKARITVNGTEAEPASSADFAFDSIRGGGLFPRPEARAMERSFGPVGPGTYVIKVQYAVQPEVSGPSAISFTLDDWQLTVEAAKA